jgi:signal transduction histidine kinase
MRSAWTNLSVRNWNIRTRLTMLYLAIFGSTLIIFCSLLYRNFITDQQNAFDIALYNHAIDIAQGITLEGNNLVVSPEVLSTGGKIFPFSTGNVFIQVLTLQGIEMGRSRNLGNAHLPPPMQNWQILFQSRGIFQTVTTRELQIKSHPGGPSIFRLLSSVAPGQMNRNFILQVAVPETLLTQVTQDLQRFLWIGVPFTLILAMFAGLYLSKKALAPVSDMIEKANSLSPNHLSERIPVPPTNDELHRLAITLNTLLDKLQRAFESQERFIADASHELKTPLAILRGELDVFRGRIRTSEEVSTFTASALQELNYLSRVVEDLLILARVDTGTAIIAKGPVQIEEVVIDVISKLEILGRPKDVKIRLLLSEKGQPQPLGENLFLVQADSDLLRVLVKNLIENAIKYSPPGQITEVNLQGDAQEIHLSVKDFGPGIPAEIIPKIFQRFYRGPASAHPQLPGAGLGLAIAQRIAEIYGGSVEVHSIVGVETTFTAHIKKF